MFAAYVVVTVLTILANTAITVADFARAEFVVANSAEVHVPLSWLPVLATLKAAGIAGLLLGLLGVPYIGIAAAIGLVLFYLGAVITHLRARVLCNIYSPGLFLAMAVATLVLDLAR